MAKNQMMDAIRRLHISNGDIVIVKKDAATPDQLKDLALRLEQMGKIGVLIMAMDDPNQISTMNETDMNRHGWFRAKNIIPLRHRSVDNEKKDYSQ